MPDVVRTLMYRERFFGEPHARHTQAVMRGSSEWSIGERELWALRIELVVHAGGDILQSKLEEVVGVSRQPARTRLKIDN